MLKIPEPAADQRLPPTLAPQRVMRLVEALAESREGMTLAQLCSRTQLPKTSLFSLLKSLADGGYVISEGKQHRLGPETYRIAAVIHRTDRFPGNVHDLLEGLQASCGETVLIGVPAEDWSAVVYVDVVESTSWLRFSANVGARRPVSTTSIGKVLLAWQPRALRDRVLRSEAPTLGMTAAGTRKLASELAAIRAQGYVVSNSSIEGATGLAAPVFNATGPVASVAIVGPNDRFNRQADALLRQLARCAQDMSARLGYTGTYPPA